MRNDFWAELELEPTADIRAIRHAYARRSRDCHPEESPEEFQQLHDAYEAALRWAKQHAAAEPAPIPTPPAAAPSQQPESSDFENPEEPEIQEIFRKKVQQNKSSDEFRKPKAAAELRSFSLHGMPPNHPNSRTLISWKRSLPESHRNSAANLPSFS